MAISAYPRTAVQNSKSNTNKPNGLSLMIVDPVTGEYTPATAATFAGGGGDAATAANQDTQILEAQTANGYLSNIQDSNSIIGNRLVNPSSNESVAQLLFSDDLSRSLAQLLVNNNLGLSAADLLTNIMDELQTISGTLQNIDSNITNGQQRVVIQDSDGNTVKITSNRLNVDTGA